MPLAMLQAEDSDEMIKIDSKFLKISSVMKDLMEAMQISDDSTDDFVLPFPNVKFSQLKKLTAYLEQYTDVEIPKREELHEKLKKKGLGGWDADFLDGLNRQEAMEMACVGHYFNLDHLQLISSKKTADLMKGATREDMREIFKLEDKWDPEQLKEAEEEMEWLFGKKKEDK